ncbi:MAG TPA: hypothetical protein VKR42_02845, partial [Ktedonobacteraceae bacterium]|nr:hypothetical protein [Ktedonobacteraceae bacterium]
MNLMKITARVLLAMVVLCGFLDAMELATSRTAHADTTPQYTVDPTTAAGGVYARYGPHINDTQRTVGYGVYPNQVVALLCGVTDGDPVGEYQNTVWHFVSDISNPGEGNFWLSDYYVDTPNLTANQLAPNESTCADESQNPMAIPAQQTIPEGASVFFMPQPSWLQTHFPIIQAPWPDTTADLTVQYQDWATGNNCTYNNSFSNPYNGKWVSILGGWSLSRLGPVYYLANATPEQVSHVHYILLIDPGNANDFGTCDSSKILGPNKMSAASVLAMWLSQNQNNHLQIMAAERTASDAGNGLSQDYLSSIKSAGLMNQVTVCWND